MAAAPEKWFVLVHLDATQFQKIGLGQHILAYALACLVPLLIAVMLTFAGRVLASVNPDNAKVVFEISFYASISFAFGWIFHILGAISLDGLLRSGFGGWVPALSVGFCFAAVAAFGFGSLWPLIFGPLMALAHLIALRVVVLLGVHTDA